MRTLTLLLLITALPALGDTSLGAPHSIAKAAHHVITPEQLERPIHLFVNPPRDYDPKKTYPTLYLLDGGALFPLMSGYYHYLHHEQVIPDMIIVGIGYPAPDFTGGNYRSTDYTAPAPDRDHWGGAGTFIEVLSDEILPYIESRYGADPDNRILFGQSIGGQFVLYAALNQPALFRGYIASNPALHRNLPYFLENTPAAVTTRARFYVASGENDEPVFREPALKWINAWEDRPQQAWALKTETLQGYGHFSIAPESFRQGLRWVLAGSANPDAGVPE